MENNSGELGVYVMQVAAMLTGMHPQTLRKYERAGFLAPSRRYTVRLYSDEDISRLRMIKHLVDDVGLNLAGVELALKLRDGLLEIKRGLSAGTNRSVLEHITSLLDEMLEMLGSY
ncbi:MAG: MerR family transcriptional regulator [Dehalococcoidales bacterium]|nr:MerR family transcriptional regulator [Dehalococcoidales bacterium]